MARKIELVITGNARGATSALGDVEQAGDSFGQKMQGIGKRMTALGGLMTASVTAPILLGFKQMTDSASDFQETLSKNAAIFGEQAKDMEAWAATGAKTFGQSRQAALDSAATFGMFGKSAGLAGTDVTKFAKDLTVLSSDLASFYNASPEEVVLALGAAFRGESEPIRRFNVMLDANTLKARAASMGIIKLTVDQGKLSLAQERVEKATRKVGEATKKFGADSLQAKDAVRDQEQAARALSGVMEGKYPQALTTSQKVLAAHAEILAQTGVAQGDYAKTSEGLANKQRELAAMVADLSVEFGAQLLPIALRLVGVLGNLVERFDALSPSAQKMVLIGAAVLAAIGPIVTVVGGLVTVIGALLSPIGLVVVGLAALAAGAIYAYRNFEGFRNAVDGVVQWLRSNVPAAFEAVKTTITNVITDARRIWDQHWTGIKQAAEGVFTAIKGIVQGGLEVVKGIVKTVMSVVRGDFSGALEGIKTMFSGWRTQLVAIVQGLGPLLWSAMTGAWNLLTKAVSNGINVAVIFVRQLPGKIVAALGDLGSLLVSAGGHVIDGFVSGMKAKIPSVRQAAASIANTLTGGLTGFLKIRSPSLVMHEIGQDTGQGFINGVKSMAGRVAAAAEEMGQRFRDSIGAAMGGYNAGKSKRSAERDVASATRDLASARAKAASLPGRIADAERRLAVALAGGEETTKDVAEAQRDLDELRRESVSSASELERAELGLVDAQDRLTDATIAAYEAQQQLDSLGDSAIATWLEYARAAGVAADQVDRVAAAMRNMPVPVVPPGGNGGVTGGLPPIIVPPTIPGVPDLVDYWINLYKNQPKAAAGAFVGARRGGMGLTVGEGGQDEIVSPVPMLREIVRSESGGGGITVIVEGNVFDGRDLTNIVARGLRDAGWVRSDGLVAVGRT